MHSDSQTGKQLKGVKVDPDKPTTLEPGVIGCLRQDKEQVDKKGLMKV
jgi:hypothetical protein